VKVSWLENRLDVVPGGGALVEVTDENIFMAINLRNFGSGIAVLHAWHVREPELQASAPPPPLDQFRRQSRDLFVPPTANGFWQGAIRGADDPERSSAITAINSEVGLIVDLLYGDVEGGQRTISRFRVTRHGDRWRPDVIRHWFIDNPDPR
jgi:hypothetical protein